MSRRGPAVPGPLPSAPSSGKLDQIAVCYSTPYPVARAAEILPKHFGWPTVFGGRPKLERWWAAVQKDPEAARVRTALLRTAFRFSPLPAVPHLRCAAAPLLWLAFWCAAVRRASHAARAAEPAMPSLVSLSPCPHPTPLPSPMHPSPFSPSPCPHLTSQPHFTYLPSGHWRDAGGAGGLGGPEAVGHAGHLRAGGVTIKWFGASTKMFDPIPNSGAQGRDTHRPSSSCLRPQQHHRRLGPL